jgi:hypothetical protein
MTSRWSLMKPIGKRTTAVSPSFARVRRWSLTSGSSHGTDGGPLRLCHTRSNGRPGAVSATTRSAAAISSASYAPPAGPATAAMASGMLCAVATSRAVPRTSSGSEAIAAASASALACTKPGLSK